MVIWKLEMSRCRGLSGGSAERGPGAWKDGYCVGRLRGLRRRGLRCISGRSVYFRDDGSDGFLSGCNLVVCLPSEPSYCGDGERKSDSRPGGFDIFLELQAQNANNINLVTPSHYVLQIREALLLAKKKGLTVPIVYNCGGYESVGSPAGPWMG